LDDLIHQIQPDQTQPQVRRLDEALSIHICKSNDHDEGRSSTELNGQFIHSQLLMDCLIRMKLKIFYYYTYFASLFVILNKN
jgi:hypothetical protein